MEDNKIKALLLHFMDYYQRRKILLQRQLIASHNALLNSMALQRRNTLRQYFVVNNDMAARFITENTRFVRFRERKKERSEKFWQILQANGNLFFQNFRMSKKTFKQLCDKLKPQLKTNAPVLITVPLTVEKQLAICLYKLASGCTYKEIGETFGVSKSTVHKYFRSTIEAILKLKNEFIKFPTKKEALLIAKEFEKITKLPNLFGVIDYTHIPILPPEHESESFMNSEGWHSMALQAVVDDQLLFRKVDLISGHVDNIFKESDLFQQQAQHFPTACVSTTNHGDLPLMLIGDFSYPLHSRILKPYTGNLNEQENNFNSHIEPGLDVSQQAFKHLKGRWQCLSQKIEINPHFVPSVVLACCILHNFLVLQKEKFSDTWIDDALETEQEFLQPKKTESFEIISDGNFNPLQLRERVTDYLNKNLVKQ